MPTKIIIVLSNIKTHLQTVDSLYCCSNTVRNCVSINFDVCTYEEVIIEKSVHPFLS